MTILQEDAVNSLKSVADRMTDWQFQCWYWGDAIAIDGLLEAHALGVGQYRDGVVETLQRWYQYCLPNFDDLLAPGAAIIQMVMDGDLPDLAGDRVLHQLEGLSTVYGAVPALSPNSIPYRYGVRIDLMYHLPATYALASRWRGDKHLARKAIQVAVDSMYVLRCETGWAHWYDPTHRANNAISWSRGIGWALLGLLDVVDALEGRGTSEIEDLAGQVLQRLTETQGTDGNWLKVLDCPTSGFETSTAAFYVAAAGHPAVSRLLPIPTEALNSAIEACHRAVAKDGTYIGVTADVLPSWDIRTYKNCSVEPSSWAQGCAVRAFAALTRQLRVCL